ncbi:MAG TPA: hypothetical protein PKV98_13505 [Burkholderiaceae bacterium]|nr:hypothetical protein [Burkholderiaceae bacterium]
MSDSKFVVTTAGMRPNSRSEHCFYCGEPVGANHKSNCVLVLRKAKVRMTIEYEIEVPASWGADLVEFQRNGGSWCASNALAELEKLEDSCGCLCNTNIRFECVELGADVYLQEGS